MLSSLLGKGLRRPFLCSRVFCSILSFHFWLHKVWTGLESKKPSRFKGTCSYCDWKLKIGSLSKSTFQGDAVVKSEKARDSRRRSRAKFNLLRTGATRLSVLHSQILAFLIHMSLLWHVLKSFVSCYLHESRFCLRKHSVRLRWNEWRWMQGQIWSKKMPYVWNILYFSLK